MESGDELDRRRQIERLLGFPGVGALAEGAIASNLGVPEGALHATLAALVEEGRLVRTDDGRYALAPSRGAA